MPRVLFSTSGGELAPLGADMELEALIARAIGLLQRLHAGEYDEDDRGGGNAGEIEAAANGQPDRRHSPNAHGGGQPAHHRAAQQDRTRA
jgi:hypothetical protein